ncbi:23S rRNA (pseudouridine(1915)-N(3))-methyltransferase RlmH [Alicyclobacillaceae bacterium I2511]|nr:23S rRNA (pseudouridine(1915)-N(3))-methyltransferase RlmH [Alicyclobacillaceae bacterium I2511]
MQVQVVAVGKLRERFWRDAQQEYVKRLSGYLNLEVVEVADEPAPEQLSAAQRGQILATEADRVMRQLRDRDGVVVLDIQGQTHSSEAWSQQFDHLAAAGYGRLVFLLGGSHGLHPDLIHRADLRWSFGPLTLPHQLARIVLLEQLYRGIRISRGEPYHK